MRRPPPLVALVVLLVAALAGVVGWRLGGDGSVAAAWESPPPPSVPAAAPAPTPRTLTVLGAGDILVHPDVWAQAATDARGSGYDFQPMFAGVAPAISAADLAICHLETVVGPGPPAGFPYFKAPPQLVDGVKRAGFDACSTVSNHTLDQGVAGVASTIAALDAAGLGHTGSYRTAQEAATPTVYDVRGVRVGHVAYALHFNGLKRPPGKAWMANLLEPEKIIQAARTVRAAGAEIVILSLHWGTEYRHAPDANQLTWARDLMASPDIDLILGHHAHVVQPFEKFGDKWVVYGMGNELARHADPVNDNREGVMARITFTEVAPHRWRTSRVEALPTWVDIAPAVRLVDLHTELADSGLPAPLRRTYQGAYDRIKGYVMSRGAAAGGLILVTPP